MADGTYWLTAVEVHAPARAGAEQHSVTLRVAGGHYELVRNGSQEEGMLSTMSIVLKLNTTCPALATLNRPYTATAKTLSLTTVSDNRVEIFTLQ